jgi:long-chain acyl-CoA synthetase
MPSADQPWLALYPASWLSRPPLGAEHFVDALRTTSARYADQPAACYFDTTITWSELDARSDALAAALAGLGVERGDRVAVYLQNVPAYLVAVAAAWKCGAAVVPVNPMNRERELTLQLEDSGAVVLVCVRSAWPVAGPVVAASSTVRTVVTVDDRADQTRDDPRIFGTLPPSELPEGTLDLTTLVGEHAGRRPPDLTTAGADLAFLTYTSGTTGPPKAAMNTHRQVLYAAGLWRDCADVTADDAMLAVAPLFHITGLVAHLGLSFLSGATLVLTHRFDPGVMLDALRERRPTLATAAITAYVALMRAPGATREDFASLRQVFSGGAPVAPATADRFAELTGRRILPGYGLTETASATHLTPPGRTGPVDPDSGALSMGIPLPGIDAAVVDDAGTPVPPRTVGEIVLAGPSVVEGYWQRPAESAAALAGGRLATGDIGFMDEEGWFYVVDRKKDQINAGGYKVWPREVEDVLYEHPAVREAAVVGAPDEYRGETVVAFVSLSPGTSATPEELIAFARERMAAYKYPRRVEIRDELPKTVSGKILRRELRDATG